MNKLIYPLILTVIVSAGCVTTLPFSDVSAEKGLTNLKNAIDDERIVEVWYRMSYKVRDSANYKHFTENWLEIKDNLKNMLSGEILSQNEVKTHDKLHGIVLKIASEVRITEVLFVAELDQARFPGEQEVVWRLRGLKDNENKTLSFGFIPHMKK
ncbi:MAG: hypothetical protein K8S87_02570 [Planctomycetes bacterium]|nr:hypothetical protein [Planctomycetota bacterium]